jgi:hypothetical protein
VTDEQLRAQPDAQDWTCVYAACTRIPGRGSAEIQRGDLLARAYDGVGLVHLGCACVGAAPSKELDQCTAT